MGRIAISDWWAVATSLVLVFSVTLLVDSIADSDLVWSLFAFGGCLSVFSFVLLAFPDLQPESWKAVKISDSDCCQAKSWALSCLIALTFLGFTVLVGIAVLIDPVAFIEEGRYGSTIGIEIYGSALLGFASLAAIQIIGDGASGIRIYRDRIEVRSFGRSGTVFAKDRISSIVLIDTDEPVLIFKGCGKRMDQLIGWALPKRKRMRVYGLLTREWTTDEFKEELSRLGYTDKLFVRFVG